MDKNTADVLKKVVPSSSFVVIVILVIFGPVDCIKIEIPGGGGITKCQPIADSISGSSSENGFTPEKGHVTIEGIKIPISSSSSMPKESYFYGQWDTRGTISKFELQYAGNFELNQDGTFKSNGTLDGKEIINSGSYEIFPKKNKLVLYPSDSKKQTFSVSIHNDDSFAILDIDRSMGLIMKRV